jgi:protein-disulfide isomerase
MSRLTPPVNKDSHVTGSPHAIVELVEYGDYQCPHCAAAHPVVQQIIRTLGDRLKFAFRHFPMANIHPYAVPAAVAAEAADRQGRFWQMHNTIFDRQNELNAHGLLKFASDIGLDIGIFKRDMQDPALALKVEAHFESGVRSGVNGTPSFFINGEKYNGSYDFPALFTALEEEIVLHD